MSDVEELAREVVRWSMWHWAERDTESKRNRDQAIEAYVRKAANEPYSEAHFAFVAHLLRKYPKPAKRRRRRA